MTAHLILIGRAVGRDAVDTYQVGTGVAKGGRVRLVWRLSGRGGIWR
jgi:hypothetical protein